MTSALLGSEPGRKAFRALVAAPRPVLFLDLDGTLAPLVDRADQAAVPDATRQSMAGLRASGARIVLVSGRDVLSVERIARCRVDAIIGNHGADVRQNGRSRRWLAGAAAPLSVAARQIRAALDVPGAALQEKPFSLALHYRGPSDRAAECMRIVRRAIRGLGLEAHRGHRLVDIRLPSVNKGIAVTRWLRLMEPAGLSRSAVCYAGDDTTDEYAFRMLPAPIVTIAVGRRTEGARLRTSGPPAFARWLARLAKVRSRSDTTEN